MANETNYLTGTQSSSDWMFSFEQTRWSSIITHTSMINAYLNTSTHLYRDDNTVGTYSAPGSLVTISHGNSLLIWKHYLLVIV